MRTEKKLRLELRRRKRVRRCLQGTAVRPRMSVRFTGQHIYVQFIDDVVGFTLAAASTRDKDVVGQGRLKANAESAKVLGSLAAKAAKAKGIGLVVFDRSGAKYHGKVKALAEAARQEGLQF